MNLYGAIKTNLKESDFDVKERKIPIDLNDEKSKEIISAVRGQIGDGIWENSPGMEKYCLFMGELDDNGNITVYTGYKPGWAVGRNSGVCYSAFNDMSDDAVKKFYANKIKQIVKREGLDWNRNNTEHCDYLDYHSGVTVRDAYKVYDRLLGRIDRITDSEKLKESDSYYIGPKEYCIVTNNDEDSDLLSLYLYDNKYAEEVIPKNWSEDKIRKLAGKISKSEGPKGNRDFVKEVEQESLNESEEQAEDVLNKFNNSEKTNKEFMKALNDISKLEWDNDITKDVYDKYIKAIQDSYKNRNKNIKEAEDLVDITNMKPIGTYTLSNTDGLLIYDIDNNNDTVLVGDSINPDKAEWYSIKYDATDNYPEDYDFSTDEEFKDYVDAQLQGGRALDDLDYVNSLSPEEYENLLVNTWMKDPEIIENFRDMKKEYEPYFNYGEIRVPFNEIMRTNLHESEENTDNKVYYFMVGICFDKNRPNAYEEDFADWSWTKIPFKLYDENWGVDKTKEEALNWVKNYIVNGVPGTFGVVFEATEPYEGFKEEIHNGNHNDMDWTDIQKGKLIYSSYKEDQSPDSIKVIVDETNNLHESDTEDYWDATELDRKGFCALLKFNNPEKHANPSMKYIITNDNNEVYRFAMEGSTEQIKDTGAKIEFRKYLEDKNINEAEGPYNQAFKVGSKLDLLLSELNTALLEGLKAIGYDEEFKKDYTSIEAKENENNIEIYFIAELDYEEGENIVYYHLDDVLKKYDKDAYFEASTSGRWVATLNKNLLNESQSQEIEEIIADMRKEIPKIDEYLDAYYKKINAEEPKPAINKDTGTFNPDWEDWYKNTSNILYNEDAWNKFATWVKENYNEDINLNEAENDTIPEKEYKNMTDEDLDNYVKFLKEELIYHTTKKQEEIEKDIEKIEQILKDRDFYIDSSNPDNYNIEIVKGWKDMTQEELDNYIKNNK